jgi:serine phosphatase RsbU (regulator of sigma subunit)
VVETLNALIIEDSADDAALIERILRRSGFEVRARRAESAADTLDALRSCQFDVVLADFTLPGFRGVDALAMLGELGLDVPFIIVSGTIDAATALEAMKAGAADYVLKDEVERLPTVVRRELDAVGSRRDRRRAETQRDEALVELMRANEALQVLAAENSRLYEAEHRIAGTLQAAMLAIPQGITSIDYHVRYVSATEQALVGGDFYDLFPIDERFMGVVVGDVSGKGLEAASLTAMVRNVIRATALDAATPAAVMARTNDVVERFTENETFVTAFFASLDTLSGHLRFVGAGHPAAMIRRSGGVTEALAHPGLLLGAFSRVVYTEVDTTLEPGDTLFLYTDGLTEARSPSREFYGERRLKDVLSALDDDLSPESMVEAVFEAVTQFTGSKPMDDMALFAVRLAV